MKNPFEQFRDSINKLDEINKEELIHLSYYHESKFKDHIKVAYRIGKIEGKMPDYSRAGQRLPEKYYNERYSRSDDFIIQSKLKNLNIILNNLEPTSELYYDLQHLINFFK